MPDFENSGNQGDYGDFTPEQVNIAAGYYKTAQESLKMLAALSDENPLSSIGRTAQRIINSDNALAEVDSASADISKYVTVNIADSSTLGTDLVQFVLEPEEDSEADELPKLFPQLQINVEAILRLENEERLTPVEISDALQISLITQNHLAAAYLDGRFASEGLRSIMREAVILQHTYEQSPVGGPTHTKIEPEELTDELIKERMIEKLGEGYYTDINFADFQRATKKALTKVKASQTRANNREFEDEEVKQVEIAYLDARRLYLETLSSENPDLRQISMEILTRIVGSGDFMNNVINFILQSFIAQIAEERGARRQVKEVRRPSFSQGMMNEDRALQRFHDLADEERRKIVADTVVGFLVVGHFGNEDIEIEPIIDEGI